MPVWDPTLWTFFPSYVLKYNTPRFADGIVPRPQAYFFQNNCHHMIIIDAVIKPGLTSN